jgi:hypothetical protein
LIVLVSIAGSLHRPLEFAHGGFARVRLARAEWFEPGTAMADALSHSQEQGISLRKSSMRSNGTRFAMPLKKVATIRTRLSDASWWMRLLGQNIGARAGC